MKPANRLKDPPQELGLSAMFRDLNGDGAPDLYVCNDFDAAGSYLDQRWQGPLSALPKLAMRCSSRFSMCVDFADINRDGLDDFIVADMLSRSHLLRIHPNGRGRSGPALARVI